MIKVRFVWVALVLFCQLPSANADTYTPGQPVDASYQEFAAQFINRHCVGCHGPTDPEGGLSLDGLGPVDGVNAAVWKSVWAQVCLLYTSPSPRD